MKLFGPTGPTALLAEDDDSGTGLNARLHLALIPGTYWVQIRHYNQQSGVGDYALRVRSA